MNHIIISGNLVADVEYRQTQSGVSMATFRVAVQRPYKRDVTDFIPCVAWKSQADFLSKYAGKGDRIAVSGSLQTRSYEAQDGSKRHVTEVIADSVEVTRLGEKKPMGEGEFVEVDDGELPWDK